MAKDALSSLAGNRMGQLKSEIVRLRTLRPSSGKSLNRIRSLS